MDGLQLFRKLGVGAKFDLKRFHNDAERLKIIKPKEELTAEDVNKRLDFFGSKKLKETQTISRLPNTTGNSDNSDDNSESDERAESTSSDETDQSSSTTESTDEEELQLLGSIKSKTHSQAALLEMKDQRKKRKSQHKKKTSAELDVERKQEKVNQFRKKNRIHVYGTDVPDPVATFDQLESDYRIHGHIVENVRSAGFDTPTPIQMQAIPAMLHRREVMACAPTGSGKTAAFIIPILHHLKEPRKLGFRALVLSPTRELAKQTCREFSRLGEGRGFRTHFIEKAGTVAKQFGPKSSQKCDILVTTPNRLVFILKQEPPVLKLSNVEWLVVDESDKLFEEGKTGFRDQLAVIFQACDSKNIKRAMFSATFANDLSEWCKLNLDNVLQVYVGARNVATRTVKQELLFVGSESGKLLAIRDMLQKGIEPPVLVFVQSKERAKELFHELIYDGINVDVIHSDRTQLQRDNVVKSFRIGKVWVLICTELMGRGIDFKGVHLVINYDFPNSAVSYIHRIGRTGRAGRDGRAVTFFTEDDAVNLRSIANIMREAGCPVPDYMLQMTRPNKKRRREMAKSSRPRESIRSIPEQDILKARQRRKKLKTLKQKNVTKEVSGNTFSASSKQEVVTILEPKVDQLTKKALKKRKLQSKLEKEDSRVAISAKHNIGKSRKKKKRSLKEV